MRHYRVPSLLVLSALLGGCVDSPVGNQVPKVPTPSSAALATAAYTADPYRYGVNTNGYEWGGEPTFTYASQANVKYVRFSFYWPAVQPSGPNDWDSNADRWLKEAIVRASNANLKIILVLTGSPDWARNCGPDDTRVECTRKNKTEYAPADNHYADWGNFVQRVIETYPEIEYLAIWNEPNNQDEPTSDTSPWYVSTDEYYKLTNYAMDRIDQKKAEGRSFFVMGPELAQTGGNPRQLEYLKTVVGSVGHRFNAISVHHYTWAWDVERKNKYFIENIPEWPYGKWPLWVTEANVYDIAHNEPEQALFITELYDRMMSNRVPYWRTTIFFELIDPGQGFELIADFKTSPRPLKSYYCLQAHAAGSAVPSYCRKDLPDGRYKLIGKQSGRALDVSDCATTAGSNVQIWDYHGGLCQQWDFVRLDDGAYKITAANSGLALDVAECSTENGANVLIWDYHGTAGCQQWNLQTNDDGSYTLLAKNSGNTKALDAAGCNTWNGVNVQIWDSWGGDCQRWWIRFP